MLINWRGNKDLCAEVFGWRSEGKTFGQIAALLTARFGATVSRSQIAGFLARNYKGGPVAKIVAPKKEKAPKPKPAPKAPKVVLPISKLFYAEPIVEEPPSVTGVTFDELGFYSCRWPYGDPRSESFRYCGERRDIGVSYCADHMGLAYRVQPKITRAEAKAQYVRNLQMLRVNHRNYKHEQRST